MGPLDVMAHKIDVLRGHCEAVGRDIAEIEFTLGVKVTSGQRGRGDGIEAAMAHNRTAASTSRATRRFWNGTPSRSPTAASLCDLGFGRLSQQPAPYDVETLERLSARSCRSSPSVTDD